MSAQSVRGILLSAGLCLGLWLGVRYLLPVAVPFLIGSAIALLAEPGIRLLQGRLNWRRLPAVGLCVSLTLLLLAGVLSLFVAVAVRELGAMAKMAPAVSETVEQGLVVLEDWLVTLADRAPDNLRPILIQTVLNTFQNGSAVLEQVTQRLPGAVASFIGWLSRGALGIGTGVIAGFLISARLPRIKNRVKSLLPQNRNGRFLPAVGHLKATFGCWLRAQIKLIGVTWAVVSAGFLLLGISYAPLWAVLVALVDAVPVLGVGTVLVPWAAVCLLQRNFLRGAGLLATFAAAWLIRTILEPRLVGKSLGLDPLVSLGAFYFGFQLWGIAGMIFAPIAAALVKSLLIPAFKNNL